MTKKELASYIDHTLLSTEAGVKEIVKLCQEAVAYEFASVCVNPVYVPLVASELENTNVKVCTVVGFPLGATTSNDKVHETKNAIKNGADEIDMVMNIGAAKDGRYSLVSSDIAAVVKCARREGEKLNKDIVVKVILETCLLDDYTIENCCLCAKKAGADFVKTSTGFANPKSVDGNLLPNGASEYHVKLMKKVVGSHTKVKASGGIRTTKMALAMIAAGADRIGTSNGVGIMENFVE